jgi:NADPH:quinone reductase-like Zn-dependent oxidoreductase
MAQAGADSITLTRHRIGQPSLASKSRLKSSDSGSGHDKPTAVRDLEGQVVLVTDATSGIGQAAAHRAARWGAHNRASTVAAMTQLTIKTAVTNLRIQTDRSKFMF